MRFTHITYITNQTACALVNNFTRNLLLYHHIFHLLAYNYCNITLLCSDLLRCSLSLSLALYNIVLLVPSYAPHIKVILPPNSTSLEVTLFLFTSFMEMEVTKKKNKKFFFYYYYAVIKQISVFQY